MNDELTTPLTEPDLAALLAVLPTELAFPMRRLAFERDRLRSENELLQELLIEALFDGTAIKSDDWKDRVHQALGNE